VIANLSEKKRKQEKEESSKAERDRDSSESLMGKMKREERMFATRVRVLENSAESVKEAIREHQERMQANGLAAGHFRERREQIARQIEGLTKEMNLLDQTLAGHTLTHNQLAQNRSGLVEKLDQIEKSLDPLRLELQKSRLLLSTCETTTAN